MREVSVFFCAMSPDACRAEGLLKEVHHDLFEREAFNALSAPLGADLVAGYTPDLFGI